jgi:hypothetical protein
MPIPKGSSFAPRQSGASSVFTTPLPRITPSGTGSVRPLPSVSQGQGRREFEPGELPEGCTPTTYRECAKDDVCVESPTSSEYDTADDSPSDCSEQELCEEITACDIHDDEGAPARSVRVFAKNENNYDSVRRLLLSLKIKQGRIDLIDEGTGPLWVETFLTSFQREKVSGNSLVSSTCTSMTQIHQLRKIGREC